MIRGASKKILGLPEFDRIRVNNNNNSIYLKPDDCSIVIGGSVWFSIGIFADSGKAVKIEKMHFTTVWSQFCYLLMRSLAGVACNPYRLRYTVYIAGEALASLDSDRLLY